MCNPITVAVELMHYGFWKPTVEEHAGGWVGFAPAFGQHVGIAIIISIVIVVIGQVTFRRFESTFAQDL
ncbi:hypothetical protein [Microbacterium gubbeenense]